MRRLTYIFFLLMIVFVACNQTKNRVGPVLTGAASTPETKEDVIPEVTFDNVLDLEVGKRYKMRPTSHVESLGVSWLDHKLSVLFFSNVSEGLGADIRAIDARFTLNPAPYLLKSKLERVLNFARSTDSRVYDEIIIKITQKKEIGEKERGVLIFDYVNYEAVAIENLTNPDRTFEYTTPPDAETD